MVIGLGHYGDLTANKLGEAVRSGILSYLLHVVDNEGGWLSKYNEPREISLASLLDTAEAIIKCYTELVKELPQSMRQFDSVVKQITLLENFVRKRHKAEASEDQALANLARNFGRIAAALDPSTAAGRSDTKTGTSSGEDDSKKPPGEGGIGSAKKAKPKAASKTKVQRGGKRPKK